jgi:hypothetical protein
MTESRAGATSNKQQPLSPNRGKFLKQVGYVGAGVALTDLIRQNADNCAVYATDGRFELFKSSKKFDTDEGRMQHGFPPQSEVPT